MHAMPRVEFLAFRALAAILASFLLVAGPSLRSASANHNVPPHYTLKDGNSTWEMDTSVQATVSDWIVDTKDHLNEISTWYRVGGSGPERSVHTLTIQSEVTSDVHGGSDPDPDTLNVVYEDPGRFRMEIEYGVLGGPHLSGYSSFSNCIKWIENLQSTDLDMHLFQYYDFDLDVMPGDDIAWLTSANRFQQFDPVTGTTLNVPIGGSHYEVAIHPFTRNHLANNSTPSTLNDMPGSTFDPVGGNVTLAIQYDVFIPGHTTSFFHCEPPDLQMLLLVPEPASLALAAIGGMGLLAARRRRSFRG